MWSRVTGAKTRLSAISPLAGTGVGIFGEPPLVQAALPASGTIVSPGAPLWEPNSIGPSFMVRPIAVGRSARFGPPFLVRPGEIPEVGSGPRFDTYPNSAWAGFGAEPTAQRQRLDKAGGTIIGYAVGLGIVLWALNEWAKDMERGLSA